MTATLNPPNGSAPQGPSRSRTVWTIAVAVVGVLVVTAFGLLIARGSGMTAADLAVVTSLNQLHVGVLGFLTTAVYSAVSPVPAIAITAVAAAAIWLVSRRLLTAVTFAIVVAFTWLPSALVKAVVHRPRPDVHQLAHPFAIQPSDASYPSGHEVFIATVVVVAFLMSRGVLARSSLPDGCRGLRAVDSHRGARDHAPVAEFRGPRAGATSRGSAASDAMIFDLIPAPDIR